MPVSFQPDLSVLEPPQLALWQELGEVPRPFVLYGGTAVALHLGHRKSVDFDFFSSETFDPDVLYGQLAFLKDGDVIQKSASTLTCLVDRSGLVQVSFFGVPTLARIEEPTIAADNQLPVASLLDLAGMKSAVVQKRAEAKDYIDLDAIIRNGAVDLPTALAAGRRIYGKSFEPQLTLKALSYFGDGDLPTLPAAVQDRLTQAVAAVDLSRLPTLQ